MQAQERAREDALQMLTKRHTFIINSSCNLEII